MLRALIAVGLLQSDALQSFKLAVHLDPTHPHAASNIKVTLAHVLSMLRPPPVSSPTLNYYPCCVLPLVYPLLSALMTFCNVIAVHGFRMLTCARARAHTHSACWRTRAQLLTEYLEKIGTLK